MLQEASGAPGASAAGWVSKSDLPFLILQRWVFLEALMGCSSAGRSSTPWASQKMQVIWGCPSNWEAEKNLGCGGWGEHHVPPPCSMRSCLFPSATAPKKQQEPSTGKRGLGVWKLRLHHRCCSYEFEQASFSDPQLPQLYRRERVHPCVLVVRAALRIK